MTAQRTYLAIDLKSFYASVECVDRHLDPLTTNLVVADASRTEKTICLAVSPSLKAYKIPGRARLFEAVQRVKEVNAQRLQTAIRQHKAVRGEDGKYHFASTSFDANALNADPALGLSYIVAPPRMQRYLDVSTQIYKTYLKYVSPADIYPYYRYLLWNHRPLTDFWMTGPGTVKRLEAHGIYTMGDLARFSIHGEDRLYEIFGVDAEILIDHAWGYEPCGMEQIKSYKPSTNSISEGQVLSTPYPYDKAKLIVREMAEILMFRLTEKKLVAESITLEVGYDRENVDKGGYRGLTQTDRYGRTIGRGHLSGGFFHGHQEAGKGEKTPASHAGHQEQVRQKCRTESQQLRGRCHHAPAQRADRRAQRGRFGWKTTKIARSDKRLPKSMGTS